MIPIAIEPDTRSSVAPRTTLRPPGESHLLVK